jgi:hypothetical protein
MVDAVFDGDRDKPGCIHMFANAKGCDHIGGLFPQVQIGWGEVGPSFPADWCGVRANLAAVVSSTETHLPLELIPDGCTIDDCTPEQLAMLLAVAVMLAGGRAAIIRRDNDEVSPLIFKPQDN